MSAFHPENYAEAVATHKPLSRATPLQAVSKRKVRELLSPVGDGKPLRKGRIKRKATKNLKAKRVKKLTDGQLKKRAWKEFSIYVRTRGADEEGLNKCVTCPERKHWKELQAGHFLRGRLNSNLFDERGCFAQCYACNVGRDGNVVEYYEWMLANHGAEVIAELKQQNNQTRKWRPGELAELLEKYRALNQANPLLKDS